MRKAALGWDLNIDDRPRVVMKDAHTRKLEEADLEERTKALLKLTVYGGDSLEAKPYLEWHNGETTKPIYGMVVTCRVLVDFQPT